MKKLKFLMLVLMLSLVFCACGQEDTGSKDKKDRKEKVEDEDDDREDVDNDVSNSDDDSEVDNTVPAQNENGLKVVIYSDYKADFIVDNAYMEPGTNAECSISFESDAIEGSFCVKVDSYGNGDILNCSLCIMPENMLVPVDDCVSYRLDGEQMTISVDCESEGYYLGLSSANEFLFEFYHDIRSDVITYAASDVVENKATGGDFADVSAGGDTGNSDNGDTPAGNGYTRTAKTASERLSQIISSGDYTIFEEVGVNESGTSVVKAVLGGTNFASYREVVINAGYTTDAIDDAGWYTGILYDSSDRLEYAKLYEGLEFSDYEGKIVIELYLQDCD